MKTAVIASPVITSENMQGSVMGMDSAGIGQATYFLRDRIYSDKILAVVREYACNALDEHAKHKIERPIEISLLPSEEDNSCYKFVVRDFALGLSEDHVRNVFGMYFRSTKSGSNDSIGGFGVGSKAGHCYVDTFYVTSYFQGTKTVYACVLGGGESGVPVGNIYEIGSCPTEETGIEISLDVKNSDFSTFHLKICDFVSFAKAPIVYNSKGATITNPKVEWEKTFGNFHARLVEPVRQTHSLSQVLLQMGGVVYKAISLKRYRLRANKTLVIDIPIGMMSLPLSRENFEQTLSNQKVIDSIYQEVLSVIQKEEEESLKDKTLCDIIKDRFSSNGSQHYEGKILSIAKSELYSEEWSLSRYVEILNGNGKEYCAPNANLTMITIPFGQSRSYWINKLRDFAMTSGTKYYIFPQTKLDFFKDLISKDPKLTIQCVKSIKFPKVTKDRKKLAVYDNYRCIGSFTPQEFIDLVLKTIASSGCNNIEDFIKKANNGRSLAPVVIGHRSITKNDRLITYYANSEKFIEEVNKLGMVVYYSTEHQKMLQDFAQKQQEEEEVRNAMIKCRRPWLKFSSRTYRLLQNQKNALKMVRFWQKIKEEQSTRSQIIKSFDYGANSGIIYDRSQFRTILKIK